MACLPGPKRRGPLGADLARRSILAGATTVFGEKGVAQASVEDILVASGISRRTFYRFFGSKEDVLTALFDGAAATFVRAFEEAVAQAREPAEKLARAVDTFLEFARASGPMMRMYFGESQRPESPLAPRRKRAFGDLAALLAREATAFVGHPVDPLLVHGLVAALEAIVWHVLEAGTASEGELLRARAAMRRLVAATLAGEGAVVPPLPPAPAPRPRPAPRARAPRRKAARSRCGKG